MKKMTVIVAIVCITSLIMFWGVGCGFIGNQSMGWGNYTFEHVHFSDSIESHCATVEKWYESSPGIEVKTTEYGPMFLSEGTYFLFRSGDSCPFCSND